MTQKFAVTDLSGWLTPDEERLLNVFQAMPELEQADLIFRSTRQRLLPYLIADFDAKCDKQDETYLREELEQWLREICPRTMLGDYLCEEPNFSALINSAWGGAGRVILGISAHDGQRADELFDAALRLWDMINRCPTGNNRLKFDRKDALAFIGDWREEMLGLALRHSGEANT